MPDRKGKCPYCSYREYDEEDIHDPSDKANIKICVHIADRHSHMLGRMSPEQAHYMYRNNGKQPVCHLSGCSKTCAWNDSEGKPNHYCSEECRVRSGVNAKINHVKVHKTEHNLNDTKRQYQMQAGRRISGDKEYPDGSMAPYMGKSELAYLDLMYTVFHKTGKHIRRPGDDKCYDYMDDGKKKKYLPDFDQFYDNILVECKEEIGNKNMHPDMVRQRKRNQLKEKAVMKAKNCHYLRWHPDDRIGFIRAMKFAMSKKGKLNSSPVYYTPKGYF